MSVKPTNHSITYIVTQSFTKIGIVIVDTVIKIVNEIILSTIFKTADISVYRKFSLWLCLSFNVCASLYLSLSSSSLLTTLGCFFQCPPPLPVQYKNETITKSQLEVLFHEILHLREPLVGSLSFSSFWYCTVNKEGPIKNTSCIKKVSCSYS